MFDQVYYIIMSAYGPTLLLLQQLQQLSQAAFERGERELCCACCCLIKHTWPGYAHVFIAARQRGEEKEQHYGSAVRLVKGVTLVLVGIQSDALIIIDTAGAPTACYMVAGRHEQ
jgi:hypothetical protein